MTIQSFLYTFLKLASSIMIYENILLFISISLLNIFLLNNCKNYNKYIIFTI